MLPSSKLRVGFDSSGVKKEIQELEAKTKMPDFWQSSESKVVQDKLKGLKKEVEAFERIKSEIAGLLEKAQINPNKDLSSEITQYEDSLETFEVFRFRGKYDKNDAILSIVAGTGGNDAQDWAAMLTRMYQRYLQKHNFQVEIVHQHQNEHGGIKTIILETKGKFAYGHLKNESGVHRLVRISPFSAGKLRHTSFALVEVMPIIEESDLPIDLKDIKFEAFNSSGPGGQNVNRRQTAVRVMHLPTGITVVSQEQRSQLQNRERAIEILRAKLHKLMEEKRVAELKELKPEKVQVSWGNQIRSYVLHPYKMVKDHRTGVETSKVDDVLNGELEGFIEAEINLK